MKIAAIAGAILICAGIGAGLTGVAAAPPAPATASCVRHSSVTTYQIASELTTVYVNCQPQFHCPPSYRPTGFVTKSIDGYSGSPWLWEGDVSTMFNIATQDSLLANGMSVANSPTYKPAGKSLSGLTFFTDIIVGGTDQWVLGEIATYARCIHVFTRVPSSSK
jgi:hypothetical protein